MQVSVFFPTKDIAQNTQAISVTGNNGTMTFPQGTTVQNLVDCGLFYWCADSNGTPQLSHDKTNGVKMSVDFYDTTNGTYTSPNCDFVGGRPIVVR